MATTSSSDVDGDSDRPQLPPELIDAILALAVHSASFDELVSLRCTSRRLHTLTSARLYRHVAVVASAAAVQGPQLPTPPVIMTTHPSGQGICGPAHYNTPPAVGLRLDVLSPSGRRIPGLDFAGLAAARAVCLTRLMAHCTTVDVVQHAAARKEDEFALLAELADALAHVTTYRRNAIGHDHGITPPDGVTTWVRASTLPNNWAWPEYEVDEYIRTTRACDYLLDMSNCSYDMLCYEKLSPSVHTAVCIVDMRHHVSVPTAARLGECAGLQEVVFIVRDQTASADRTRSADDPMEPYAGLGVLHYLVLAVARAHQVHKATFVGAEMLDDSWFGDELGLPPVEGGARGLALRELIVAEVWRDYAHQRAPLTRDDLDDDSALDDPPDAPPEIAVLSFQEFATHATTAELYELCTAPCALSSKCVSGYLYKGDWR